MYKEKRFDLFYFPLAFMLAWDLSNYFLVLGFIVFLLCLQEQEDWVSERRRHCIIVAVNGGTVWILSEVKAIEGIICIIHNFLFEFSLLWVVGFSPSCWIWIHSTYTTWDWDLYLLFKVKSFPVSNHLASFKGKKQQ